MTNKQMTDLEYPIPLRLPDGTIRHIAKVRCPVELALSDVETIYEVLKTLACDAPESR